MGWSAPVLRFGTLILVGPPLELLPCHRNDRFPRSTQKPESSSRRLHTGCHSVGKQVSSELILRQENPSVLTSPLRFRHVISGSFTFVSLTLTWHDLLPCLFLNAHHNGSLPMQLKVVWSLLLQADSERPTLISCAALNALFLTSFQRSFVAHLSPLINTLKPNFITHDYKCESSTYYLHNWQV